MMVMADRRVALTTVDNPYNPVTDFSHWLQFDNTLNYGTSCYLARIANTSDDLTDEENNEEVERAIDEIMKFNPGIYKKVVVEL